MSTIVLDKGEIVEFDTPQNLKNKKNSKFYSLSKNINEKNISENILFMIIHEMSKKVLFSNVNI